MILSAEGGGVNWDRLVRARSAWVSVSPTSSRLPFVQEVADHNWLVAVRTETAKTHSAHEASAVLTPLLAEGSGVAGRAHIDGDRPAGLSGNGDDDGWHRRATAPRPGPAPTGIAAVEPPARGAEGSLADRADHRRGIVAPRGFGPHGLDRLAGGDGSGSVPAVPGFCRRR